MREFLIISLLRNFKTLTKHFHQVKLLVLEENLLAIELCANDAFFLLDVLGAVGDLLEHDLHHVHLADGQALHLRHLLFNPVLVLGRLHFRELLFYFLHSQLRVIFVIENLTHIPRVEGKHRVGLEVKLFARLDSPGF